MPIAIQISELKLPMLGVDPSMVLCYRDEYRKVLGKERGDFTVQLVHEWLQSIELLNIAASNVQNYALFGHCSEKATASTNTSNGLFL